MKKNIFMMMILVLIIGLSTMFSVVAEQDGELRVSLLNQDPDPVEPGKYVDIRLKVENSEDTAMEGVLVEFVPSFPFTLNPGEESQVEIGTLSAFQNGEQAPVIKYKLRVNDDAIEGANTVSVRVKHTGSDWSTYKFDVNIRTTDATLNIESVKTTPSPVEPGKETVIEIQVKNLADSVLKDVSMNLDLLLQSIPTATGGLDALPFAPMDSGTEKKVPLLKNGEVKSFSYKVKVYPTAESRVYKIPLQIKYFDEAGTEYIKNDIIGVVVNSKPDVSVLFDGSEIDKAGTKGEFSVRFINKGLNDIKFLNAELKETDGYDIISSSEVYIGNIDSDDYETIDYEIYVKPGQSGDVNLPVHYEYLDSNNNKYTKSVELKLKIFSAEELTSYTPKTDNTKIYALYALIGAVALIFIYRVFIRKKD